jgi:hypothetical protein
VSAGSTSNVNTRCDVADSRRTIHRGTATICTSHAEERMKITSVHKLFRIEKRAKLRAKFMSQYSGWHINLSVSVGGRARCRLHSSASRQEKRNGPDPSPLSGVAHAAIIHTLPVCQIARCRRRRRGDAGHKLPLIGNNIGRSTEKRSASHPRNYEVAGTSYLTLSGTPSVVIKAR